MKHKLSLLLALCLLATMVLPAFADGGTTVLTTTVPEAEYVMTIPADKVIPFNTQETEIGAVDVEAVSGFSVGKNVEVVVNYDSLSANGVSTTIPYFLSYYAKYNDSDKGSEVTNLKTGDVLTFGGASSGKLYPKLSSSYGEFRLIFSARASDWGAALAGNYSSTITFTASVVAAN